MLIPSVIPGSLSIRGGSSSLFSGGPAAYNYALGGLPFLSAASNTDGGRWWIRRETAPFRKQQYDSAQNPGEQSLDGFWLRSVMSWHGGAGQLYADPVEGTTSSDIRFHSSVGVSVWTPGTLSLLHDSYADEDLGGTDSPAPVSILSVTYGTDPGFISIGAAQVFQHDLETDTYNNQAWVGSTILSACTDGARAFVVSTNGVYRAPLPATPSNLVWTKIYNATPTTGKIAWVKDRIVLGADTAIYELSPDPVGPPIALPAALYTAKASGWIWTDITETTSAIYAVGHAQNQSAILKFTLSTTGALPTLTGGTIACQLPGGETALSAYGYLGTFLAIGTSKGARIAVANDTGDLTYGPLLWENGTPVYGFTARDHWIWATYSDPDELTVKAARIDLGLQIDTLRFAWATDMCVDNDRSNGSDDGTDCKVLAFAGNSTALIFGTTLTTWVEDTDHYQTSGWLQTSRVRFNTLEPKIFRSVRVRGPELEGSLNIAYVTGSGSITPVFTYGVGDTPGGDDIALTSTVMDFLALRFTLNDGNSGLDTAEMFGWQIKALPGSPRQRMLTVPMWCFDVEKDKHGVRVGGEGYAWSRLLALEGVESAGDIVTFQDLDAGVSYNVFIESLEFQQESPPAHWKEPGAFGGRLLVTMRTV